MRACGSDQWHYGGHRPIFYFILVIKSAQKNLFIIFNIPKQVSVFV
jgi:hypothetical protein